MTKIIPLTQGQVALVDDEDYTYLSKFKWYARYDPSINNFYVTRCLKRIGNKRPQIQMARIIMNTPSNLQVDHINHNTLDNRKSNLRNITQFENHHNQKQQYQETCGFYKDKYDKYVSSIGVNGIRIYLGYFDNPKDARNAYLQARKIYHVIQGDRI